MYESSAEAKSAKFINEAQMNNNGTIVATLSAGLFALGLLVGTLMAMSEHSLAQGVIAALFALFGGTLIGFLSKLSPADQFKAAAGILAISIGTLIGVYSGIVVNACIEADRPDSHRRAIRVNRYSAGRGTEQIPSSGSSVRSECHRPATQKRNGVRGSLCQIAGRDYCEWPLGPHLAR
jgi:hypothetical protein